MKDEVRVACVQMDVAWLDPAANLACIGRLCERVADEGDMIPLFERERLGVSAGAEQREESA